MGGWKLKIPSFVFVLFVFLLLACACNHNTPNPTPVVIEATTASSEYVFHPTSTRILLSQATIAPPFTLTPISTNTPTSMDTPTASSSSTPTITPTATPSRVQPGIYNTGHCAPYTIGYYINVNMCVDQVAVQSDYTLIFSISWTMHMPKELQTPPRLDMKVLQMYLIDNLGNRSSVVTAMNWTGSVYVHEGSVISVDLSFPPAAMGALIFTLFDDEHGITISVALSNPVQFYGYMELKKYPFVLRYPLKWWKSGTSGAGDGVLTHLAIANCTITEKSHGAPQGTLINTIAIGPITYQIYRYYAKDYSVREYLAIDGVDNIDSSSPPFLNVTIPFDKAETCLLDASEVLANLQLLSAGNP